MDYKQSLYTWSLVFSITYIEIISTRKRKKTNSIVFSKIIRYKLPEFENKTEQQFNVGVICYNLTRRGKYKQQTATNYLNRIIDDMISKRDGEL
jgi:hypothetical protein